MSDTDSQLTPTTMLTFARELRRLAGQVERGLLRKDHVVALSALTAMKPLTGALTSATLSEAMASGEGESDESTSEPTSLNNPLGYL